MSKKRCIATGENDNLTFQNLATGGETYEDVCPWIWQPWGDGDRRGWELAGKTVWCHQGIIKGQDVHLAARPCESPQR